MKQQEDRAWFALVHVEKGDREQQRDEDGVCRTGKDRFVQILIDSMSRHHKRHSSLNVILLACVIDGHCCQLGRTTLESARQLIGTWKKGQEDDSRALSTRSKYSH